MRLDGIYTVWAENENGLLVPLFRKHNTQMVESGFAIAKCMGMGDVTYKIGRMYIEFENVAAPATAVSVPTFSDTDGIEYYRNLTSPKDYLRVPFLGEPSLSIETGYEAYFSAPSEGNKLTFVSQTAGTTGVNGVSFDNALNSKVYGVALVAAPSASSETQDVLISRDYFTVAQQQVKPASGQLTVSWEIAFVP